MTVTNYFIARNIRACSRYLVASEGLGDSPEFVPDEEWVLAARSLFGALNEQLSELVQFWDGGSSDEMSSEDILPWKRAYEEGHREPHGWEHRIVQLMLWLRDMNKDTEAGIYGSLGDTEFRLIWRAIDGEFSTPR